MRLLLPLIGLFFTACLPSPPADTDAGSGGNDATTSDAGPRADARPVPLNAAVYAHSPTELFRIDPDTLEQTSVGTFTFQGSHENITDIAIDKNGNMIGVSLLSVYSIDKDTAAATFLSSFSQSGPNSLSFVPVDINDQNSAERLVAADFDGGVWEINPNTGQSTLIGDFNEAGTAIGSSGDLVSIIGFGTLATVNVEGEATDYLARIDPVTWRATLLGDTGRDRIFGIGFWGGKAYGFTDNQEFLTIDVSNGHVLETRTSSVQWWGAGVTTIAPIVE